MKNKDLVSLVVCLFAFAIFISLGSASVPTAQTNYTSSGSTVLNSGLQITQLNYQPYPANPGEYIDVYIKVQTTSSSTGDTAFEFVPQYPFSLDPGVDPVTEYGVLNSQPVVLHYKVKVDENAVPGTNQLQIKYTSQGGVNSDSWAYKTFDVQVADAQTNFDLVVQDSSGTSTSLAIANIGENTANSLIVRIPDQPGYATTGTNGQMVGNLASGDYSIVSFTLQSAGGVRAGNSTRGNNMGGAAGFNATNFVGRNMSAGGTLKVEMDYTDSIGVRRTVIKDVRFSSVSSGNSTRFGAGRTATTTASSSGSLFSNMWFWIVLVVVVLVGFYIYKKNPEKVREFFSDEKRSEKKGSKNAPDWVVTERTKKK